MSISHVVVQCKEEFHGWVRRRACLLAMLMSLVGCATGSQLDRLDQSLSQRLDTMAASIRADSSRLSAQLESQNKRQQELSRSVEGLKSSIESEGKAVRGEIAAIKTEHKAVFEEMLVHESVQTQLGQDTRLEMAQTKKALDQFAGKTQEELGSLGEIVQSGSKEIRGLQQALASFSARLEQLPALVSHVGSELHGLNQTLMGSYKLEEAALRERLKAVEQVLKQLEPMPVKTTQAAPTNSR
jgi:archaellum component FlaC